MEKDGTFELKDHFRDTLSDSRPQGSSFSYRCEPKSDHYDNLRTVDDLEDEKNEDINDVNSKDD
jgi:hypothetical protein